MRVISCALACWQGKEVRALQVVGNQMVELLLGVTGNELFDQRDAVSEWDVFEYLTPEGALADRFQSLPKRLKIRVGIEP